MPAPNALDPALHGQLRDQFTQHVQRMADPLAAEIAELRKDIASLRDELRPVSSLIVTGQRALDAFERLTRGA